MIIQEFNLNMIPDSEPVVVHVNQYDTEQGRFVIHLYNGDTPYTPSNASVLIEGRKPDGKVFAYGAAHGVSISGNTVTAPCLIQMTAMEGRTRVNLIVKENGASTGTFVFWLDVQETPINQHVPASDTEIPALVALAEEQAERSEAWAVGTKNGQPVSATDPTFDNNAKYWAEQAASSVTGVASFNGRGGSVLPMAGDYNAEQITFDQTSNVDAGLKKAMGVDITLANYRNLTPTQKTNGTYNVSTGNITANLIKDGKIYGADTDIVGNVETIGQASANAYTQGKYMVCVNDGAEGFYKAKTSIAVGDTITVGTNVEKKSISEALADITAISSGRSYSGTTMAQLQTAVASLSVYDLMNSVLVANNYTLGFWDWTASRTRWGKFQPETTNAALYVFQLVNSSATGITLGTKTTSSYTNSTEAITSWTLYIP